MKTLTKEEKQIIKESLILYLNSIEKLMNTIKSKDEITKFYNQVNDIWLKIYLELYPIKIKDNNMSIRAFCPLCGQSFKPGIGKWAFAGNNFNPICYCCFKKYDPKNYKKVCKNDIINFPEIKMPEIKMPEIKIESNDENIDLPF